MHKSNHLTSRQSPDHVMEFLNISINIACITVTLKLETKSLSHQNKLTQQQ